MARVAEGDLALLHRLEEGRLDLGGSAVDLVGQEQVREDRALARRELPGLLLVDHRADEVGGQQVGSELDARELEVQDLAQGLDREGLGQAGQALDQEVAPAQEGHHHPVDEPLLAHDDLAHLVHGRLDLERLLPDLFVQLRDVDLGLNHGSSLRTTPA